MPNAIYPTETDPNKMKGFTARHKWIKKFVSGKRVLDLGCGSGYGTSFYSDKADFVLGVDYEADNIVYAQSNFEKHNVRFRQHDMRQDWPCALEKDFDVIVMCEVLEHFHWESAQKVLKNAFKLLKPGGLLIGTTPKMTDHTRYHPNLKDGEHCVLYHRTELIKQLSIFQGINFYNLVDWAHVWTCQKPHSAEVDVVILSLDRISKTSQCVKSLYSGCDNGLFRIIVVENGSNKHIQSGILNLKGKHPDMSIIFNKENMGVGRARKQAEKYGDSPYLIHLDNDMKVSYGFIEELLRTMKQANDIGVVGSKVVKDGRVQLHGRMILNGRIDYSADNIPLYDERARQYKNCDIIHGGATLYRRSALNEVEMDERYIIGYEDLDIMLQLRERGWRLVYCPKATAYHYPDFSGEYANIRRNSHLIGMSKEYFESKWRIQT